MLIDIFGDSIDCNDNVLVELKENSCLSWLWNVSSYFRADLKIAISLLLHKWENIKWAVTASVRSTKKGNVFS